MKMLRLLGSICVALVLAALIGCFGAGLTPEDGETEEVDDTPISNETVTVSLSGAGEADGDTLLAYAYEAGEWIIDMTDYVVGAGYATITDGSAEFVLTDEVQADWTPAGDEWTATGGNYDLYIYTHSEGDVPMDRVLNPYPKTVAVDGGTTVPVDFADFDAYVATEGRLTASVSGAQEHAGKSFFFGVWEPGGTPEDNPLASGADEIAEGGSASAVAQLFGAVNAPEDWTGDPEGEYDVYMFIDPDGGGTDGGPGEDDLIYKVASVEYWQYGDKNMPTRYEDFVEFVPPEEG